MTGLGLGLAIAGGVVLTGLAGAGAYHVLRRPPAQTAPLASTSATAASLNPQAGLPYQNPPVQPTSWASDYTDAVNATTGLIGAIGSLDL